ncbi:hypothetical protein, partial [Aeromonas rivipollensis]|uniref:hypothetical protein n=1 Tax=Aeromonas rivipollensis TaxID=948519 RepID=UPI003D2280B1
GDKIRSQSKPFLYLFQLVAAKDPVHVLDLAAGFLKSNPTKSQFITILAVDEPELSLHATACLKQFEKLRADIPHLI